MSGANFHYIVANFLLFIIKFWSNENVSFIHAPYIFFMQKASLNCYN
jgi:hypothetical protein